MTTLYGNCRLFYTGKDYVLINGLYCRHVSLDEVPTDGPLAKYFWQAREYGPVEWWQPAIRDDMPLFAEGR